jgi:O-methyltransferase involved in polyketide biosynthesis
MFRRKIRQAFPFPAKNFSPIQAVGAAEATEPNGRLRSMEGYDFRRVSVTALIPAFARGEYTEIPWAKEMLAILRERGATVSTGPWSEDAPRQYASWFEARFRAVSRLLEEKRATQVLELAAGLSPRGMDLAQRGVVYVEADLAESIALKREIVTAILGSVPENLHLRAASVIDREQLLACCSAFVAGRPVAATTEGLLRYLTFEEKTQLAANVHEILRRYGGWWITPDIHLKGWADRQSAVYHQTERQTLGRSLDSNYFADLDHAQQFFEGCGFAVDSRPLLEGIRDQIAALHNDELMRDLNERRIFVLTPKR